MNKIPVEMSAVAAELKECKDTFTALGDENRQLILIALLENYGGMRVGEITKKVNLSRPAVSHHLQILKNAGFVSLYKIGTMNFYHINPEAESWHNFINLAAHINSILQDINETGGCSCSKCKKDY